MESLDSDSNDSAAGSETFPYRRVFEALEVPVLIVDADRATVVEVNRAAVESLAADRAELCGLDVEAICERLRTPDGDHIDPSRVLGAESSPTTVRGQLRDGEDETFWAELSCSSIEVEGTEYGLWTIEDRSELRRREQDRRAFETAVEHAGHAIYLTDVEGRIEYANPAFEDITGYDREAVIGKNPRFLQSGEMTETYYRELWETILDGETFEREVIDKDADGNRLVLDQTVAPIPGPSGEVERFVAVNNDITERKEREESLQAEKERIDRLHQRLSVTNRILRHDIRSSVNIIRGNAELAGSAAGRLDQALETIVDEADRLQRIGESVRHIQEVLSDDGSSRNVLDLVTLAQTKVLTCRNEYPSAEFALEVPETAPVQAREGIELALEHLLTNAVEHNDSETPSVEVSIETSEDAAVRLRIADDGPGIPPGELRPIREGRETPLEHTSGLGLWLSHWIVEASEGDLSFEDREPRGTVVTIELAAA